jgi:hypothetical protein
LVSRHSRAGSESTTNMNGQEKCEACSLPLGNKLYRLPSRAEGFCSIACIEAVLFGGPHCRWCGENMAKSYTSIDSRLCSKGCAANYRAHVLDDGTAILGSGKRFRLWLARNAPPHAELEGRRCANTRCRKDHKKYPAKLDHLRAGTLFCSTSCKMQVQRSPNPHFSPSKRAVFIAFSSNALPGKPLGVNPGLPAPQRASQAVSG